MGGVNATTKEESELAGPSGGLLTLSENADGLADAEVEAVLGLSALSTGTSSAAEARDTSERFLGAVPWGASRFDVAEDGFLNERPRDLKLGLGVSEARDLVLLGMTEAPSTARWRDVDGSTMNGSAEGLDDELSLQRQRRDSGFCASKS
jgi:hypothetical protein